jgi:SSS family solute:Na+ symporter
MFYVGMLATIMSTLNTLAFVSATTLGRDIVARMRGKIGEGESMTLIRWALVITSVISVALCVLIPSVIGLWYTIGTVFVPGLLVPLVSSYFPRWKAGAGVTLASMVTGVCVSLAWLLVGWGGSMGSSTVYPMGLEPMIPGLLAGVLVWGAGRAVCPIPRVRTGS